ncbi:MAG: hypothetical protein JO198_07525 [Candidatus Dormibacteraeota bacterium]|nr:hypothetical protein [Candidatus Dormibacteraeota bacterium]
MERSGEKWGFETAVAAVAPPEERATGWPRLSGTYHHRLDPKGRVAVPSQLRRWLPDGSMVAPGPERRLMIWPPDAWDRHEQRFRNTAETPAQERHFLRTLSGNTYPLEVDAQGRMLLTAWQRSWAGIAGAAVFVGLGEAVELTGEERWQEQTGDLDPDAFTRLNDLVLQRSSAQGPPA